MYISRETARNRLQVLQHARTGPIDIGAVFEHNEHIAIVKHRLGAHGLNIGSCEQCRHNRITHLVLDDVGGLAFPVGVNDHLDIGYVREGVKRDMPHTPNSGQSEEEDSRKDQEAIVGAPFNDARNHDYIPPVALTESCLFAIVWPFCCAVIVTCHVPPDPRAPLPSYIPPPLSLAWTTVFIAAIPIAGIAAMKKVMLTCAPAIGFPAESVNLTRTVFTPFCGGEGSVVSSTLACVCAGTFIAAACPAPGGGGMNAPAAAANWASESIRKFADVTICSPTFTPFEITD